MSRRLEDPDDPRWLEAERRLVFLRGLLKANGWTATREVVEATRHEFRIGRSTVYRMIARFRASRKASSSDPNRPRHPRRRQALGYHDRTPHQPRDRPLLVEEGEAKDECLDSTGAGDLSDRGASAASSQHHPAPRCTCGAFGGFLVTPAMASTAYSGRSIARATKSHSSRPGTRRWRRLWRAPTPSSLANSGGLALLT